MVRRRDGDAASKLAPLAHALMGADQLIRLRCWDGSGLGPEDAKATLVLRSPMALRRLIYAPGELGFARAYAAGELDVEGDLLWLLATMRPLGRNAGIGPATLGTALRAAAEVGALGLPPAPPAEEARPARWLAPVARDSRGVAHHYDVGNDFYRLVLGPTMTYSCARFVDRDDTLEKAQEAKHDLICRKLGLRPGMRLLDVGCGWGAMALHAARRYGARVVGITLSRQQHEWATAAVRREGLEGQVEVRVQHFQELGGETFDAICSVGMYEHVAHGEELGYFRTLHGLLRPGGRLLNHAISKPGGSHYTKRSFLIRYIFPNGELRDIGTTLRAMQAAGFEARDVESLREHYALTLRQWVANLERHWQEAVGLAGSARARIWRLYMTGAIDSFESATIAVHQALGVKLAPGGRAGMPLTRAGWS